MDPRVTAGAIIGIVVVATVLAALLAPRAADDGDPAPPGDFRPSPLSRFDANVTSFDDTRIVFTVWRPANASASTPVPLVLLAHGVTADRGQPQASGLVDALVDAGFGVLALDLRGHGESGGLSRLSDPDQDVRDLAAVLDWSHANLDWIVRQPGRPRDLLVGAWGFSLGGAMVHLSAALDGRIDAIVPQNTMNDYLTILAPGDAIKSVWANLFIAASRTGSDVGPVGHWRADPVFEAYYAEAMATNRLSDPAKALLARLSPYTYMGAVRQPALYIQGFPDMAFPASEAFRSRGTLVANGSRAHVLTWLGGHHVAALQPAEGGSPCGAINDAIFSWFDETLRGGPPSARPAFSFALDDGSCVPAATLPPIRRNATLPTVTLPANAGSVLVPVLTAEDALRIVGSPLVTASAAVVGVDDVFYASLVAVSGGEERVLDSQVTPLRLAGPATDVPVRLEMNPVAALLKRGDQLFLKIDRVNEWFITNSGRTPGALVLSGPTLGLPLVD